MPMPARHQPWTLGSSPRVTREWLALLNMSAPSVTPEGPADLLLDIGATEADILQHMIVEGAKYPPFPGPLAPGPQPIEKTWPIERPSRGAFRQCLQHRLMKHVVHSRFAMKRRDQR